MAHSLTYLQSTLEQTNHELDIFVERMIRYYPDSKDDIGAYILKRLSNHQEGSQKYQKWNILWSKYCDLIQNKMRTGTAITNCRDQAFSII